MYTYPNLGARSKFENGAVCRSEVGPPPTFERHFYVWKGLTPLARSMF